MMTCTAVREALKKCKPVVKLVIHTGKVSKLGYSITKEYYFRNAQEARTFSQDGNLYGWTGSHWSSDAVAT